ncbi:MAG: HD family phosphohydrolase [Eubacteriaceae bacterium]
MNGIKLNKKLEDYLVNSDDYRICVDDIIEMENVRSMEEIIHHSGVSCLTHCLFVSYTSYLICKRFDLNYLSAARGALLHDFYLYDWHIKETHEGLHGFKHPYTALKNAERLFFLNDMEVDIIVNHMWPLTLKLPKYKESYIVSFADKYCSLLELMRFRLNIKSKKYNRIQSVISMYTENKTQ